MPEVPKHLMNMVQSEQCGYWPTALPEHSLVEFKHSEKTETLKGSEKKLTIWTLGSRETNIENGQMWMTSDQMLNMIRCRVNKLFFSVR